MADRPDLDDAAIRQLASQLIGTTELRIAPVQTAGMEAQAVRLSSDDQHWCLRLGTSLRSFGKDQWAHEVLGDRLPIPRVFELGQVDAQTAFCLSEWKQGVTLQDLPAPDLVRTLPAVFEVWSMINTVDHEPLGQAGAGNFDPRTGSVPSSSWPDDLLAHADRARAWMATPHPEWPEWSERLEKVITIYESLIDHCPDPRDLVHGDFGCNNMLAADGHVTGVLDWEAATIGDRLVDVSGRFWATHPPVAICVSQQAAYSDHLLGDLPGYQKRVLCYDLRTGLSEIDSALSEDDRDFAEWALHRCLELIGAAP